MATLDQADGEQFGRGRSVPLLWSALALLFVAPVVCRSLAQENTADGQASSLLVLLALAVTGVTLLALAFAWRHVVRNIGNAGLATIALVAGLQFSVSYAARLIGYLLGALLGPLYVFVDGIGSKGLSCLFMGLLVTLIPKPGVLALALSTLFVLNLVTMGQAGLVAIVFAAVSIGLHEGLAAALGVTTARGPKSTTAKIDWSFVLRAGLAIGLANGLALYLQYALYELLMRLYFDAWYKLSVSIVTGLIFGGTGACIGAALGLRLRRTAP